jgi:hypothetical protein
MNTRIIEKLLGQDLLFIRSLFNHLGKDGEIQDHYNEIKAIRKEAGKHPNNGKKGYMFEKIHLIRSDTWRLAHHIIDTDQRSFTYEYFMSDERSMLVEAIKQNRLKHI